MLHPFVSARPRHVGRPSQLLLSITAHVIFVYALFSQRIVIQHAAGDVARVVGPPLERIRFLEVAPAPTAPELAAPRREETAAPASITLPPLSMPTITPISIDAPSTAMPDVDLTVKIATVDTAAVAAGPKVTELVTGIVGNTSSLDNHSGPFLKNQVDKVVIPFANNPKPTYPFALQRQGVETSFVAQFVVDSTGRVDDKSILFPPDAHSQFVESVRRTLRRSKYYPAEIAGQRVPQLVEQRFTFVLVQGR